MAKEKVRTGLRSIRLIRKDDEDQKGTSFYFELNGVPVFMKGANHIPNDSFVTEVRYERYRHEIMSAVESNMNMLRVWGGGIYEHDYFYELCDENGILVWQDFMFACSMYPGDTEFLENVQAEAIDQVRSLRNHPSIALWCGNNEMDSAWAHYIENIGWGWKQEYSHEIREKIWADYQEIFHHILPKIVNDCNANIEYWPSSPMSELTEDANQHAQYTSTSGDMHYWDVWHGVKPLEEYKEVIGRFMSEYGFQSFPELKTVRTYAKEDELELTSDVMLHHQKNGRGNQLIKEYMENYYKQPKDFPAFLYMSHILQADAIKSAIEAHRGAMPYCMGTLYWQMNDCWPVASWSSMDYYGRWKALQYIVKKHFKDVKIIIDQRETDVQVKVVSDQLQPLDAVMTIQVLNFSGEQQCKEQRDFRIHANTVTDVQTWDVKQLLAGNDANEVVLYIMLEVDGQLIDDQTHFFTKMKEIELTQAEIIIEKVDNEYILRANTVAKSVWLDTEEEGIFSDNYFDLIPGI